MGGRTGEGRSHHQKGTRLQGQAPVLPARVRPEPRAKVWLVLDGNTLYVDRDGDGDLTGAGQERPAGQGVPDQGRPLRPAAQLLGRRPHGSGGRKYTALTSLTASPTPTSCRSRPTTSRPSSCSTGTPAPPSRSSPSRSMAASARSPRRRSESPKDAPVLHFGGAADDGLPPEVVLRLAGLRHGKAGGMLTVVIGTPGVGEGSSHARLRRRAERAHPVAEIVFPARTPRRPRSG